MANEYTPIFYHNFTKKIENNFECKIACDGEVTNDDNGLLINSDKYTQYKKPGEDGLLDHIKWLSFLKKSYLIKEGEFIYEACMSAQQLISPDIVPKIYLNRIRNIREDYRLCCSGIVVYDEENKLTVKILFTDDWIYGYYERFPGYKTGWTINKPNPFNCLGDYAGFASIIPLCKRGANSIKCKNGTLDDFENVGIGIDSCKGTIKFYVNRCEMFCINKIGYRLSDEYQVAEYGGIPYIVKPRCVKFGFGHFSYLDHNIPNNYSRGYVVPTYDGNGYPIDRLASGLAQLMPTNKYREPYPDFMGEHSTIDPAVSFAYSGEDENYLIFGQGMTTRIRYIAGYVVNNKVKMHKVVATTSYECSGDCSDESSCCKCSTTDNDTIKINKGPLYYN